MLARKFSPAKWEPKDYLPDVDCISADALTGCLRTQGDTLSVWRCSEEQDSVQDVVLAFGSLYSRPDKMHILLLNEDELRALNIPIDETRGETPVKDLRDKHCDLARLTASSLLNIAELVARTFRTGRSHYQFRKNDVVSIVADAVKSKRLAVDQLQSKMRLAVEDAIG